MYMIMFSFYLDCYTVSRNSLWLWFLDELFYLGKTFIRRCKYNFSFSTYLGPLSLQVPFTTMIIILLLWFGISFPLVFGGFYFGYRKQPYEQPVRTNQIPRQIPEQPWYLNPFLSSVVAGILPFGAIFVELFFILSVS